MHPALGWAAKRVWLQLSEECRDLLDRIFTINEQQRISIQGIKDHAWYNKPLLPKYQAAQDGLQERQAELTHRMQRRVLNPVCSFSSGPSHLFPTLKPSHLFPTLKPCMMDRLRWVFVCIQHPAAPSLSLAIQQVHHVFYAGAITAACRLPHLLLHLSNLLHCIC